MSRKLQSVALTDPGSDNDYKVLIDPASELINQQNIIREKFR